MEHKRVEVTIKGDNILHKRVFNKDGKLECEFYTLDYQLHSVLGKHALTKYHVNGTIKAEWHCHKGKLHSINDEPAKKKYHKNGTPKTIEYYNMGKLGRNEGPAYRFFYKKTGIIGEELYIDINGQLHNYYEPAVIRRYPNGKLKDVQYWMYGMLENCNDEVAAVTKYYETGFTKKQEFYNDNLLNGNNKKPALIIFHENGKPKYAEYRKEGLYYRDNDSDMCVISYDTEGSIISSTKYSDIKVMRLTQNEMIAKKFLYGVINANI